MRTNILPSELSVGQRVCIGRYGSWGNVSSQGLYVVAKVNKLKVVLKRESDGYERVWSVKRNVEIGTYGVGKGEKYVERNTFIESIESMEARNVKKAKEQDVRRLWSEAEQAAQRRNLAALKDLVAQLEAVQ